MLLPGRLEGEVNVGFHVLHDLARHVVADLVAVDQVQAHVPAGGGAIGALVAAEWTNTCVGALMNSQLSPRKARPSQFKTEFYWNKLQTCPFSVV